MKSQNLTTKTYVLTGLISYWLLATSAWAEDFKGAACIIYVGDKIVLVRDFLSNRLSFPGGYINPGETAQHAVARETFEETGLNVAVGPQIGNEDKSAQFLCRSHSAIPILTQQGFEKKSLVYPLSAPDFSIEIRQVYLLKPTAIKPDELRFPNQIRLAPEINRYPGWYSDSILLSKNTLPINAFHNTELHAIARLQKWLAPNFDMVFRLFNLIGENTLFFILIPFIWTYSGWQTGVRFMLLLILSAELNNILKVIFGLPRPFHLMPELQRMDGYGFGLPSGHVLVATTFWGYCWHSFKKLLPLKKQNLALNMLIFLLSGCALARVYWGVHFISDVLAGAVFGLLILFAFIALDTKGLWNHMALATKTPWLSMIIVLTVATFYTPGWLSSQLDGLTSGIFLGLLLGKTDILHKKITCNNLGKFITAAYGIAGIFLLDQLGKTIINHQGNSIIIILVYYVSYLMIGLWLTIGMYLLPLLGHRIKSPA